VGACLQMCTADGAASAIIKLPGSEQSGAIVQKPLEKSNRTFSFKVALAGMLHRPNWITICLDLNPKWSNKSERTMFFLATVQHHWAQQALTSLTITVRFVLETAHLLIMFSIWMTPCSCECMNKDSILWDRLWSPAHYVSASSAGGGIGEWLVGSCHTASVQARVHACVRGACHVTRPVVVSERGVHNPLGNGSPPIP
jgi:hypothetical protein